RPGLMKRALVSVILFPIGTNLFVVGGRALLTNQRVLEQPWWFSGLLLLAGVAFWAGGCHFLCAVFRCHEHGLSQRGLLGARRLRYEALGSVHGQIVENRLLRLIPLWHTLRIKFVPRPGPGLRRITLVYNGWAAWDLRCAIRK